MAKWALCSKNDGEKMNKTIMIIFLLATTSPLAQALDVTKGQWVSAMKTGLPAAFCKSSQYFRQCFKVTAIECEETAASSTRFCLADLHDKIPTTLHQPQDGTKWGGKVGQCAGTAYVVALADRKISNAKCNDATNWQ